MGGSQSNTRRVSVELDGNDPSTVKISSDVLLRLREGGAAFSPSPAARATSPAPAPKHFRPSRDDGDVERLEKVYKQKIEFLEELNDQLHKSSKENFNQAVKEVESKFMNQTFAPICLEKQNLVYECYKANPGQSMLCSDVVKDFLGCVNLTRQKVLTKKG